MNQKRRGRAQIKNYAGNERKCSGRTDFAAASGDLLAFAQTSRAIDKRIGRRAKLRRHQERHRNQAGQNPPAHFLDVIGVEHIGDHKNEREMQKVANGIRKR